MKKKWIVIPSLLLVTVLGAAATVPLWRPLADRFWPQPEVVVDGAMRTTAIDTLVKRLNDHYVFPDKAKQIETVLRQRQQEGKYDGIRDGEQLAKQLTDDLHGVARDLHMTVGFSPRPLPPDRVGAPPETKAAWEREAPFLARMMARFSNLGVERVDRLGPKVGYLQVSGFPPHFLMHEKYAEAMNELADTDGLIIDLRENGGGGPQTVALLVSYFVDGRTRLNDIWERETGNTIQFWTEDKLDGKRYGGKKPVMILVGPGTMSAGEDFAYTMQALKRATIIGAPTWGGAHPARPYRLGEHFYAVVPSRRTISPITNSNWEGTGVIPDIAAKPDQALETAKGLMQRRLQEGAALAAARQ